MREESKQSECHFQCHWLLILQKSFDEIPATVSNHKNSKFIKEDGNYSRLIVLTLNTHTVMRNYGMNQDFSYINPERDFQPFNDGKNSHL